LESVYSRCGGRAFVLDEEISGERMRRLIEEPQLTGPIDRDETPTGSPPAAAQELDDRE